MAEATIRKFVKIKPMSGKTNFGQSFNALRLSFNRIGSGVEGVGQNLKETTTLLEFQTKFFSDKGRADVKEIEDDVKKEVSLWSRVKNFLKKKRATKKRKVAEQASEEMAKEVPKEVEKGKKKMKKPMGFFSKLMGFLGTIFKYFIVFGALDWLSKNGDKIVKVAKLFWTIGKFVFKLTSLAIGSIMDGLTNIFGRGFNESGIKRGFRFVGGMLQLAGGLMGLRYLMRPWKLVTDARMVMGMFQNLGKQNAATEQRQQAFKNGYIDKETGRPYTKQEYEAMRKAAKRKGKLRDFEGRFKSTRGPLGRAKDNVGRRAGNIYKGAKGRMGGAFNKFKGSKMGMRSSGALKRIGGGSVKGGLATGAFAAVGGITRTMAGLASGEAEGRAVGAGVGQAAGSIAGAAAVTAIAPFLGPLAPMIGSAIGGFLGEKLGAFIGDTMQGIVEPLKQLFSISMEVIGSAFKPLLDEATAFLSVFFEVIGGLVGFLLGGAFKVIGEFTKFVFGTGFKIIGETVSLVIRNVKRLMNPGSVAAGIFDFFTFNAFDVDKGGKAAGGKVDTPQMAEGGYVNLPQITLAKMIGSGILKTIKTVMQLLGPLGEVIRANISQELAKLDGICNQFSEGGPFDGSIEMRARGGSVRRKRPKQGTTSEDRMAGGERFKKPKPYAKGGKIFLHWTGGGYNFKSKGSYHSIIQGDGSVYKAHPYDQRSGVAHTYLRNSSGIGMSIAAMGGNPDYWSVPVKDVQVDALAKEIANVGKAWGWSPSDINIKNVMTHAEAASGKDGLLPKNDNYGPTMWGGDGTRWDLLRLKKGGKDGEGGNIIRAKARAYMGGDSTVKEIDGTTTSPKTAATPGAAAPSDSSGTDLPETEQKEEKKNTIATRVESIKAAINKLKEAFGGGFSESLNPAPPAPAPTSTAASGAGVSMSATDTAVNQQITAMNVLKEKAHQVEKEELEESLPIPVMVKVPVEIPINNGGGVSNRIVEVNTTNGMLTR